jgi:signal transduction histidine kinase
VRVEHHLAVTFADISIRKRIEQRSTALFELTQALAHATSREAVGAVVLDRALPAVGVTMGNLSEVDPLRQELVLIAERGHQGAAMRAFERYSLSADTPGAEAVRTGELVTMASRQEWVERFPIHVQWADDAGVEGSTIVPLRVGDRVVGIIALQVRGPRVFDADERQFLLAFADQCAQALERVRLFDAERRAREELARVFEEAPVAIALTRGSDHRFQIANPRYETLVGRTSVVGMTVAEALPELREQGIFELMDTVLATGKPYVGMDTLVWLDRGPGREREEGYFTFVFQPVTLSGLHTDGIAIVANDVTPQVLARMESDRLRTAAEAANLAKSDFLASMSHELRTPLNAIGGYADLLLLGVRGAITADQRTDLERINHSQRHLLGVINDILNFARVDAGNVDFVLRAVAIRDVMDDVQPLVMPQLGAKALSFECDPGAPGLAVHADAEKVRQIVLNLLANAIKFTDDGGKIWMTAEAQGDRVALSVHDTGIGIEPDRLAAVFEPFVQVHRTLARPMEGTGLGLTISRELARAMGGDLMVESTLGVGSTFTLTLPRAES